MLGWGVGVGGLVAEALEVGVGERLHFYFYIMEKERVIYKDVMECCYEN